MKSDDNYHIKLDEDEFKFLLDIHTMVSPFLSDENISTYLSIGFKIKTNRTE